MVWYFAYGSNMDPERLNGERLKPKGVAVRERIGGRLDGWRLAFNKVRVGLPGAGAANIEVAAGAEVHGTLNEMPEAGLVVIDKFEGVETRQYRRESVAVVRADTGATVEAVTYVAINVGSDSLRPQRDYLEHLLAARDLLPAAYYAVLAAQPTADRPINRPAGGAGHSL